MVSGRAHSSDLRKCFVNVSVEGVSCGLHSEWVDAVGTGYIIIVRTV